MTTNANPATSKPFLVGEVVSNSMDKSVVVRVTRRIKHPMGKYITRHSKIMVHDPENRAQIGETVRIEQCRPISKRKTWQLAEQSDSK